MTYDNFTIKAREAIQKAQQIAAGLNQQHVDTAHLIRGIMETEEEVATFLFNKCEVSITGLRNGLEPLIQKTPKVKGTEKQYLTKAANRSLSRAKKALADFGDQYISIELMLLGILQGDDEAAIQASIRQIAVELKLLGVSCLVWLSVPYGHKSKVGMERFPLLVGGYLS